MGSALLSGVSGMKAHQTMIDVAGDNIANLNTNGYKSSRTTFSTTLSQTIREASQPTTTVGGSNPMQIGSGVQVASIDRDMAQGTLINTGRSLDMAIEGEGYFCLNDGSQEVYTRVGNFAVDSNFFLVDPSNGYRLQRRGEVGVSDGFQTVSNNGIRIPYDVALPAAATTSITYSGNLSADDTTASTSMLSSNLVFTTNSGDIAVDSTDIVDLDQVTTAIEEGDLLTITGTLRDGTTAVDTTFDPFSHAADISAITTAPPLNEYIHQGTHDDGGGGGPVDVYTYEDSTTPGDLYWWDTGTSAWVAEGAAPDDVVLGDGISREMTDLMDSIQTAFGGTSAATVSLFNGEIRLTDVESGFSRTDFSLGFTAGSGSGGVMTTPSYFKLLTAGGETIQTISCEVFDSQGISHVVTGTFARQSANLWDFVLNSVTGDLDSLQKRRIEDIAFGSDGSYQGVIAGEDRTFKIEFPPDAGNPQTIEMDLGSVGEFSGLTQFGGQSTASPGSQDGYAMGSLSSLSVSREGTLVGIFTNGARRDIAAMRLATFQNPAAMEGLGGNYFLSSANSGDPVITGGLSGGAGAITGGTLEGSNVDIAQQFVNLIQAQNGFQANARTIRVSNEILRELTNLIR